jgi:hypothetical protein
MKTAENTTPQCSDTSNRIRIFPELSWTKTTVLPTNNTYGHNAVSFILYYQRKNLLSHNILLFIHSRIHSCAYSDIGNISSCTTLWGRISEQWTVRDVQGSCCHLIWNTVLALIWRNWRKLQKTWPGTVRVPASNTSRKQEDLGQLVQPHSSIMQGCQSYDFNWSTAHN